MSLFPESSKIFPVTRRSHKWVLWNQGCCCWNKKHNFFNGKTGTFEVIETENLHWLWPWLQSHVKPKESEGCLKTDLENKQEYQWENQWWWCYVLAVSNLLFGFSNLNDVPQVDARCDQQRAAVRTDWNLGFQNLKLTLRLVSKSQNYSFCPLIIIHVWHDWSFKVALSKQFLLMQICRKH